MLTICVSYIFTQSFTIASIITAILSYYGAGLHVPGSGKIVTTVLHINVNKLRNLQEFLT